MSGRFCALTAECHTSEDDIDCGFLGSSHFGEICIRGGVIQSHQSCQY